MFFDLPLQELRNYKPNITEPEDFDRFWKTTIEESEKYPSDIKIEKMNLGFDTIDSYDITYNGFEGQKIKAWLNIPKNIIHPIPCIIEYIGYGGGRGFPIDWLLWSSFGYAHFIMDTRGQGSTWRKGDTADIESLNSNPQFPGFLTRGILNAETYYYRRVFMDAYRAVDVVKQLEYIDNLKIGVTGTSQGGGIALAVSGLRNDISIAMPDVPFLCHFKCATEITNSSPYNEITNFLKIHRDKIEIVFNNLSYFDGINFAKRSSANSLFSVGLMDETCPPRTIFAAFNHYRGNKEIKIYEYNDHEGGQTFHELEKIKFVKKQFNLNNV